MGIRNFQVISIGTDTSTQELNVAAAGNIAIPTTEGGGTAKFLHIKAYNGVAGDFISVTPDIAANNGAFATGYVLRADLEGESVILNVHGYSFIGFDKIGGVTADLQLTPLEDY